MNEAFVLKADPKEKEKARCLPLYGRLIKAAAECGGIESLPVADRMQLHDAVEVLGVDAATVASDATLWRRHLDAVRTYEQAGTALASHRTFAEIDVDLVAAKDLLGEILAKASESIRVFVDQRNGRRAAESRLETARAKSVTPSELSAWFRGFEPTSATPTKQSKNNMNEGFI